MAAARVMAVRRALATVAGRYDRTVRVAGARSFRLLRPATMVEIKCPGALIRLGKLIQYGDFIPKRGHEVKRFLVNDAEVPCSRFSNKALASVLHRSSSAFGRQRGMFLIGRRLYRVAPPLMPFEESLRAILQGVQLVGSVCWPGRSAGFPNQANKFSDGQI